jgi:hypothetical protein
MVTAVNPASIQGQFFYQSRFCLGKDYYHQSNSYLTKNIFINLTSINIMQEFSRQIPFKQKTLFIQLLRRRLSFVNPASVYRKVILPSVQLLFRQRISFTNPNKSQQYTLQPLCMTIAYLLLVIHSTRHL